MPPKFFRPRDDTPRADTIGDNLKRQKPSSATKVDPAAVAKTAARSGFTRKTDDGRSLVAPANRRGRPPSSEVMTYWRVYIAPDLRDRLVELRDVEGRRMNDLLADMLAHYESR